MQQRTQKGNSYSLAQASLIKAMMQEILPDLAEEEPEYSKRYRQISNFRKLGGRLELLVERFGYGIIGLLPTADVGTGSGVGLDDRTYVF